VRSLLKNNPLTLTLIKELKKEAYDWLIEQWSTKIFLKISPKYKKELKKTFLDETEMKKKVLKFESQYKNPKKFMKLSRSQARDAFFGIVLLVFGFLLQIAGNISQFLYLD